LLTRILTLPLLVLAFMLTVGCGDSKDGSTAKPSVKDKAPADKAPKPVEAGTSDGKKKGPASSAE